MISVFVDFFNFLGAFLNLVLNLSYYLGKLLVAIGIYTYEGLKVACTNLGTLFVILYEDFSYFSSDIWAYIEAIGNTVNNGIKSVIDGVVLVGSNIVYSVKKVVMDGGFKISNFVTAISDLIGFLLVKMKEFLLLLGNGMWFLVTLVPKLIMAFGMVCWKGILDLWEYLKEACRITSNRISIATKTAYNYFIDVPFHCALGLLLLYFSFRYRHKIFRLICYIYLKVKTLLQHYSHEFRMYRIRRHQRQSQRRITPPQEIDLLMSSTPPLFAPTSRPSARKPLRRSPRSPQRDESSPNLTQTTLACVICMDRKKTVVVLPCRHLCLCAPCSKQLRTFQNSCPLCRKPIERTIDAYI